MKNVLYLLGVAALTVIGLSGCSLLTKNSPVVQADLVTAATCVGEVTQAAPACVAEVPSCVALGKTLAGKK